jgi:mannose-6-phosphate isomerase-like protein (cupin superfamily)
MKLNIFDIGGEIVKQDDRYTVTDNKELKSLVLSSTVLHRGKSTSGHKHPGQEEVYIFVGGHGEMELDDHRFSVQKNDVILVKDGVFHRVHNTGDINLIFVCVFDGKRNH